MEDSTKRNPSQAAADRLDGTASHQLQIADVLLSLISEHAKQGTAEGAEEFRARIRSYRGKLWEADALDEDTTKACIDDCEQYFRDIRDAAQGCAADFSELIELLKEALLQAGEEEDTFHEKIFASSDRFKRLAQLDDIQEIRSQLGQFVRELRHTVLEKQQQDEQRQQKLAKRVQFLESRLEAARQEALRDPLTGVANRGGFDRALRDWIMQKKPFVLGMIDLDNFKSINDVHGHRVGDSVLVCASQWIAEKLRTNDIVARYGGDEFAILLGTMNLSQAERKFTALLADLSGRSYVYTAQNEKRIVKFTMSCGFAEFGPGDTVESLVQRSDEALYEAKKQRNQVASKRRTLFSGVFGRG